MLHQYLCKGYCKSSNKKVATVPEKIATPMNYMIISAKLRGTFNNKFFSLLMKVVFVIIKDLKTSILNINVPNQTRTMIYKEA